MSELKYLSSIKDCPKICCFSALLEPPFIFFSGHVKGMKITNSEAAAWCQADPCLPPFLLYVGGLDLASQESTNENSTKATKVEVFGASKRSSLLRELFETTQEMGSTPMHWVLPRIVEWQLGG